jgi:hypothetical protein
MLQGTRFFIRDKWSCPPSGKTSGTPKMRFNGHSIQIKTKHNQNITSKMRFNQLNSENLLTNSNMHIDKPFFVNSNCESQGRYEL